MSETETGPAISVSDIRCGYDETVVLDKVSFEVSTGEVFFIIGGSGCGKSTLLRNLIGIHRPQAGTVNFFGHAFEQADSDARLEISKGFGVHYQSSAL